MRVRAGVRRPEAIRRGEVLELRPLMSSRHGVAARYRAWDERLARRSSLGHRLDRCRVRHDAGAGRRLAGSTIPQGHATGCPIYRLEWQGMGSLERRLRGCRVGVRAEPFAFDSAEFTALALHLRQRAAGMAVETPAVRP